MYSYRNLLFYFVRNHIWKNRVCNSYFLLIRLLNYARHSRLLKTSNVSKIILNTQPPNFNLSRVWVSCLGPSVVMLPELNFFGGFLIFRFRTYLMKVIPETRCVHLIWNLRFYFSDGRYETTPSRQYYIPHDPYNAPQVDYR